MFAFNSPTYCLRHEGELSCFLLCSPIRDYLYLSLSVNMHGQYRMDVTIFVPYEPWRPCTFFLRFDTFGLSNIGDLRELCGQMFEE